MSRTDDPPSRRKFLTSTLTWSLLAASVGAAYASLGAMAVRFLYPRRKPPRLRNLFVSTIDRIPPGKGFTFIAPTGQKVLINNLWGNFVALSDTCPHLGCKVHWSPEESKFVCPCHQGRFDPNGIAVSGPPADERKNLLRFDLVKRGNALYIRWPEA